MFNHVTISTQESDPTVPAHTIDNVMIMFETPTYNRVLQYVEDMLYSSKNRCKESLCQCCFTTLKEIAVECIHTICSNN